MKIGDLITLLPLRRQWFLFKREQRKRCWLKKLSEQGVEFSAPPEILGRVDGHQKFISIGTGSRFERDITFWLAPEIDATPVIEIGEDVYVGRNCYLGAHLPLKIGRSTIIGAYSYIITANHRFQDKTVPIREQGYKAEEVVIGEDVWIGCHVVILPGVVIGDHAIVGAGAVVTHSIPPGEIWGGVPARRIGER